MHTRCFSMLREKTPPNTSRHVTKLSQTSFNNAFRTATIGAVCGRSMDSLRHCRQSLSKEWHTRTENPWYPDHNTTFNVDCNYDWPLNFYIVPSRWHTPIFEFALSRCHTTTVEYPFSPYRSSRRNARVLPKPRDWSSGSNCLYSDDWSADQHILCRH